MRAALAATLAVALSALGGCTEHYVRSADDDVARLEAEHVSSITRSLSGESQRTLDLGPTVAVPTTLTLADALRIATLKNRDYVTHRENVYLNALGLSLVRHNLRDPIFSGQLQYLFNGTRHGPNVNEGVATLGVTQVLPTGGSVNVTGSGTMTQQSSGLPASQAGAGLSVNVSQPLLRGVAPYAFEPLTQGEHELVYALRDFELFRQNFAIQTVAAYYGLIQQKQRVGNTRRSASALEFVARRAKAFFEVGRDNVNKIEFFRAQQSWLRGKNGVIDEEQAFKLSLDRYKIALGVSIDATFDVPEDAAPDFVPVTLDLETAVNAAFENRLDLKTARDRVADAERQVSVAENQLLPDLVLTGGYTIQNDPPPGSYHSELGFRNDAYNAALSLTLPLERTAERNNYRAAIVRLEQARRALRDAEDNLIVEVRDSLRTLRQKEEAIKIQKQIIETETARAKYSDFQLQAGEIGTRDASEARESLLQAENDMIAGVVAYEVQRLTLLRQIGKLVVDEQGRIGE